MGYKDPDRQREYQRLWRARRRAEFFDGKVCADCPRTDQLELHHLDPSQKEHHGIWSWSKARREAELEKCIVLCVDCHDNRHGGRSEHGTLNRYNKYGCRCAPCREVKAEERRRRKAAGLTH